MTEVINKCIEAGKKAYAKCEEDGTGLAGYHKNASHEELSANSEKALLTRMRNLADEHSDKFEAYLNEI